MTKKAVILLLSLAISGCKSQNLPDETPTRTSCEAKGAFLDHRGMFGTAMCVTPYSDAYKICEGPKDCGGSCLRKDEEVFELPIGTKSKGQCQADDALFGCYVEIIGGKTTQGICVD